MRFYTAGMKKAMLGEEEKKSDGLPRVPILTPISLNLGVNYQKDRVGQERSVLELRRLEKYNELKSKRDSPSPTMPSTMVEQGRKLTPGPPLGVSPVVDLPKTSTPKTRQPANTLLQDLQATEMLYVEELSMLQSHYDKASDMYAAIENLKLSHDESPMTADGIESWFARVSSHYARYIQLFQYASADSPQIVYLSKRPLVRLEQFAKAVKETTSLKNRSTLVLLNSLEKQAQRKLESVKAGAAAQKNQFIFTKVKSFDTLQPVAAATFDTSRIKLHGQFDLTLDHPHNSSPTKLAVEAYLLGDKGEDSLALCSLEYPGQALLFPVFRHGDLMFDTTASNHALVLYCCICTSRKKIKLERVASDEDLQISQWRDKLGVLFASISSPTLPTTPQFAALNLTKHEEVPEPMPTPPPVPVEEPAAKPNRCNRRSTFIPRPRKKVEEPAESFGLGISFANQTQQKEQSELNLSGFAMELEDSWNTETDTTMPFALRPPSMFFRPPRLHAIDDSPLEEPVDEESSGLMDCEEEEEEESDSSGSFSASDESEHEEAKHEEAVEHPEIKLTAPSPIVPDVNVQDANPRQKKVEFDQREYYQEAPKRVSAAPVSEPRMSQYPPNIPLPHFQPVQSQQSPQTQQQKQQKTRHRKKLSSEFETIPLESQDVAAPSLIKSPYHSSPVKFDDNNNAEPAFLDDSEDESYVTAPRKKTSGGFMKKLKNGFKWGKKPQQPAGFRIVEKQSVVSISADYHGHYPLNDQQHHAMSDSIGTAVCTESNNCTVESGSGGGSFQTTNSYKSLAKSTSSSSVESCVRDYSPPASPPKSCDRVSVFQGGAIVSQWHNKRWIQLINKPTFIEVTVSAQGGLVSGYSEPGSGQKQLEMELYLSPQNECRKSTVLDVQISQTSHITMFRLKSSSDADKFLEALRVARRELQDQSLLYQRRQPMSAPSMTSSHSSLGSVTSAMPPPPPPPMPQINEHVYSNNSSPTLNGNEEPQLMLLNSLRCMWFSRAPTGGWLQKGDAAKLSVFSVTNSSLKKVQIKVEEKVEKVTHTRIVFEQVLRPRCFQRVGKVGVSVRHENDETGTSEIVNMIQLKGDKEARYVNDLLTTE